MILGDCPYGDCTQFAMRSIATGSLPQYERDTCEGCHRIVWVVHSRIDPIAYTEADFLEEFVVDDEKKTVVPRHPQPALSPTEAAIARAFAERLADQVVSELLERKRT